MSSRCLEAKNIFLKIGLGLYSLIPSSSTSSLLIKKKSFEKDRGLGLILNLFYLNRKLKSDFRNSYYITEKWLRDLYAWGLELVHQYCHGCTIFHNFLHYAAELSCYWFSYRSTIDITLLCIIYNFFYF